tara:strand:- start:2118 stop:2483 length:366 start_codon:yes stop_codon:yes gene_type:complete
MVLLIMPKKSKFGSYGPSHPGYVQPPPQSAYYQQLQPPHRQPSLRSHGAFAHQQFLRPSSNIFSLPTTPLGIIGWLFIILLVGLWFSKYIVIWKTEDVGSKCGSFIKVQTVTGEPLKIDKE